MSTISTTFNPKNVLTPSQVDAAQRYKDSRSLLDKLSSKLAEHRGDGNLSTSPDVVTLKNVNLGADGTLEGSARFGGSTVVEADLTRFDSKCGIDSEDREVLGKDGNLTSTHTDRFHTGTTTTDTDQFKNNPDGTITELYTSVCN